MMRQRFSKPADVALFLYGNAPDDPADPPTPPVVAPRGLRAQPRNSYEDIWFKNCDGVDGAVLNSMRRLHNNLGHPSRQEMLRFLQFQPSISSQALQAAKGLECNI
eukprot:4064060-Amphidinium_carterae.1